MDRKSICSSFQFPFDFLKQRAKRSREKMRWM